MRNLGYYPPQTDVLSYSKGGYGGEGAPIGGYTPMPEGGMWITIYPHPPHNDMWINKFGFVKCDD